MAKSGYYIEYHRIGSVVKVSAIDPYTLKEVCIIVPANKRISNLDMERLAVRKLEYVLRKEMQELEAKLDESTQSDNESESFQTPEHFDQKV